MRGILLDCPLTPAFIHMDVKYASNAGAFTCLPQGEGAQGDTQHNEGSIDLNRSSNHSNSIARKTWSAFSRDNS